MNSRLNLFCGLIFLATPFILIDIQAAEKPRVIVSTDIGGSDPDDFQSMVHFLVSCDRFDVEGLVSSPPKQGRAEHIFEALDAYEADYENLSSWSDAYPTPDTLRAIVRQGAVDPQDADVPDEQVSRGARLIIERAKAEDDRPLYVIVWGSITDVAQAVHSDPSIKKKLRIHSIGSWNTVCDPKARDYLYREHADLWWIESDTTFRGMYMGGDQSGALGNRSFPAEHVAGHGALGRLFMEKKADIKMGDTPSVLYLMHGDRDRPSTEHWGGSFIRPEPDARPTYWHDDPNPLHRSEGRDGAATVNRWRKAYLDDWRQSMDRAIRKP